MINSKVDFTEFNSIKFFIKRDDLLDAELSGNKARKLYQHFISKEYKKTLISFGGNQSNLMYSLSAFANKKNMKFIYYLKKLPKVLLSNPIGNLYEAQKLGMNIVEVEHNKWDKTIKILRETKYRDNTIFINQGGLQKEAELGVSILAQEIDIFFKEKGVLNGKIFLPSGTGATALYLQKHSSHKVFTTPCIGNEKYLISQFKELESNSKIYPTILNSQKKYHFGKLYREFYQIWQDFLSQTNIELDLLYDPKGVLTILEYKDIFDKDFIYIHCGGIKGNKSMINRYLEKF